ncbi:alanine racemase [Xylella taiwanensis]|uniref:Alanine racemase n=1 Tax=Xylella taiwanensis TaxID=1444770 RepID=A0ABS8TU36_9GAMM|nr:alanine racemase [Xylella taiwanensis]AXI84457.1 alanine racemase [Xylella taiwanensis]MCD8455352.1 alanine racemase [Xylella taiwanensis]MCD8457756.1 alanine racemase [Xylella taiwanensis]MCD8459891.1 alanine racemase [Xylella taiwanensis]MCD8464047.1 alanine racemase [Xylella taiwanensis]
MRPAHAVIDLDALRHNYRLARRVGGGKALAVVKADAYGHGAVWCAQALEAEADGFAVACIEEALELRQAGIRAPILLLEGFFEAEELELIAEHRLWTVIASPWQVRVLAAFHSPYPIGVWLKLDSGMHRLGLDPQEFREAWLSLCSLPQVGEMVLMTHLACADELDNPRTNEQAVVFAHASRGMAAPVSVCNSSGLLGWAGLPSDWARPGLMLYGVNPFPQERNSLTGPLRPVMMVYSKVIAVLELPAGEPVGYSACFVTERPTRVGVVAMGYADGYPQFASNGTPVLVDGRVCPLVGRVSMDMLTVDLTDHVQGKVGSQVQLWGVQPSAAELAARGDVSAYQLLCGLKRVRRCYLGEMGPV